MPHPVHPLSQRVHHLKLPKDVPCNPTALPCRPGLGVKRFLYGQGEAHTQGQDHGDVRGHGCLFSGNLAYLSLFLQISWNLVKRRYRSRNMLYMRRILVLSLSVHPGGSTLDSLRSQSIVIIIFLYWLILSYLYKNGRGCQNAHLLHRFIIASLSVILVVYCQYRCIPYNHVANIAVIFFVFWNYFYTMQLSSVFITADKTPPQYLFTLK